MDIGVRMSKTSCPYCGKGLDAASSPHHRGARPSEGDLGMCVGCGGFMKYNKELKLDKITTEELLDIDPRSRNELFKAHEAWTIMMERRGQK